MSGIQRTTIKKISKTRSQKLINSIFNTSTKHFINKQTEIIKHNLNEYKNKEDNSINSNLNNFIQLIDQSLSSEFWQGPTQGSLPGLPVGNHAQGLAVEASARADRLPSPSTGTTWSYMLPNRGLCCTFLCSRTPRILRPNSQSTRRASYPPTMPEEEATFSIALRDANIDCVLVCGPPPS